MTNLRLMVFGALALLLVGLAPAAQAATAFANPAFQQQWAAGEALAPNFWGPLANATDGLQEPYQQAPNGQRLVQYFDKGRMELTNNVVTNGLLATELTTGQMQMGDATFQFQQPPTIPIAGDLDNPGPTYDGLFRNASSIFQPAGSRIGSAVQYVVAADGSVQSVTPTTGAGPYTIASFDGATQHNVAQAFLDYRNRVGLLTIGYAKSEPFQTTVKVAGQSRQVMVQVFERRILTYNPANPPAFQVEMANIGQHYYQWRYPAAPQSLVGGLWAWQETRMSDGTLIPVSAPSKYTVQFMADGTVAIQADCNRVTGRYNINGSQLTIALGAATLIACPPGSQADEFLRQLSEIVSYTFSGSDLYLSMRVDSGNMRFAALKEATLTGTNWQATSVNNGRGAVQSAPAQPALTAIFGTDGQVSGSSGCNTFNGPYQLNGASLTIGPLATTRMACEPTIMTLETAYLAALAATRTQTLTAGVLELRDASGALQVSYKSQAAVTGTVTYVQRIALAPGSIVRVSLDDVSRADVPAVNIGSQTITTTNQQVPIPYAVTYDPSVIVPQNTYAVSARITAPDGTTLLFISDTRIPVITNGSPTSNVEIMTRPV